jgi:hypothetical protein
MARVLLARKTSIKSNIKPIPVVKESTKKPAVEFRWSTTAAQLRSPENNSLVNIRLMNLDDSSRASLASIEKSSLHSPRLPIINNIPKKTQSSASPDENNHGQVSPLLLHYSELHRPQIPSKTTNKSRTQLSIYSLLSNKRNHISAANKNVSLSSHSTSSSPINDKYFRLPLSQLRRLQVSNKYIKEAKTLYFNPVSKVFVPRHSIVQL